MQHLAHMGATPDSSSAALAAGTLTTDGRFIFDGIKWHAVPLAPESPTARRPCVPLWVAWFLVYSVAVVAGGFLFTFLVSVALVLTH